MIAIGSTSEKLLGHQATEEEGSMSSLARTPRDLGALLGTSVM